MTGTLAGRVLHRLLYLLLPALFCVHSHALAHGLESIHGPRGEIAVGPSIGYAHIPNAGGALTYGVDATWGLAEMLWVGGGIRSFERFNANDRNFLPYGEAGVALTCLVLGGGVTIDPRSHIAGDLTGPHLFLGLVLPLSRNFNLYLDPHYRATFSRDGNVHEAGLLLKWTSFDF